MGSDVVWQTNALRDPHLNPNRMLSFDRIGTSRDAIDTTWDVLAGRTVQTARLPACLFMTDPKYDQEFLPDFFHMAFPCVSERLAELLQEFDLSRTKFLPIDIQQSDQKTIRPDKFYIMNIVSQKSCWVREESHKLSASWIAEELWSFKTSPSDGMIAVRASAAEGTDLWVDPVLQGAMFVSDRLYQAWKATTMMPPMMEFYRCKLVD